jgi:hypothetical protein
MRTKKGNSMKTKSAPAVQGERKEPKNVTLNHVTLERAEDLIRLHACDTLSALIAILIREETERRHGLITMGAPPSSSDSKNPNNPGSSQKTPQVGGTTSKASKLVSAAVKSLDP